MKRILFAICQTTPISKNLQTKFTSPAALLTVCLIFLQANTNKAFARPPYQYTDSNGVIHLTDDPSKMTRYKKNNPKKHNKSLREADIRRLKSALMREQLYSYEIEKVSNTHGIDSLLVKSVIKAESNFNPYAVSKKGAQGLMQLIPETAKEYGVKKPFDPHENITGGVKYLKYLFRLFKGDLKKILAAYNAGHNAVLRYKTIPPYKETQNYVKKVIAFYREYQSQSQQKIFRYILEDGTVMYTDQPRPYQNIYK